MRCALGLVLWLVPGCGAFESAAPRLNHSGRVLFIGSSYLLAYDIPGIVAALADSAHGKKLSVTVMARPGAALIDQWEDASARDEIARGGWEWVVLQQGPSSLPLNRDTLRLATKLFASEIARVAARPALFSVWPAEDRKQDFARAIESYTLAAADVNGVFLPIAASWLAAWDRDPSLQLYYDGLHASPEGAYLAALVIYARLLGKTPRGLPNAIVTSEGWPIEISPERALLLQDAAATVLGFPSPALTSPRAVRGSVRRATFGAERSTRELRSRPFRANR